MRLGFQASEEIGIYSAGPFCAGASIGKAGALIEAQTWIIADHISDDYFYHIYPSCIIYTSWPLLGQLVDGFGTLGPNPHSRRERSTVATHNFFDIGLSTNEGSGTKYSVGSGLRKTETGQSPNFLKGCLVKPPNFLKWKFS